MITTLFT